MQRNKNVSLNEVHWINTNIKGRDNTRKYLIYKHSRMTKNNKRSPQKLS